VSLSDDEKLHAFISMATFPGQSLVYDSRRAKRRSYRIAQSRDLGRRPVESQVVRFKSFTSMTVPNILYRPHASSAANPVPALVWFMRPGANPTGYSPLIQFLANHGYVVLGINNRGAALRQNFLHGG